MVPIQWSQKPLISTLLVSQNDKKIIHISVKKWFSFYTMYLRSDDYFYWCLSNSASPVFNEGYIYLSIDIKVDLYQSHIYTYNACLSVCSSFFSHQPRHDEVRFFNVLFLRILGPFFVCFWHILIFIIIIFSQFPQSLKDSFVKFWLQDHFGPT